MKMVFELFYNAFRSRAQLLTLNIFSLFESQPELNAGEVFPLKKLLNFLSFADLPVKLLSYSKKENFPQSEWQNLIY